MIEHWQRGKEYTLIINCDSNVLRGLDELFTPEAGIMTYPREKEGTYEVYIPVDSTVEHKLVLLYLKQLGIDTKDIRYMDKR